MARPKRVLRNPKFYMTIAALSSIAKSAIPKALHNSYSYIMNIGEKTKKNLKEKRFWIAIYTMPTNPNAIIKPLPIKYVIPSG